MREAIAEAISVMPAGSTPVDIAERVMRLLADQPTATRHFIARNRDLEVQTTEGDTGWFDVDFDYEDHLWCNNLCHKVALVRLEGEA